MRADTGVAVSNRLLIVVLDAGHKGALIGRTLIPTGGAKDIN